MFNRIGSFFRHRHRRMLKMTLAAVEAYAVSKKTWGNNFPTLILLHTILIDYSKLLDQGSFYKEMRKRVIKSSFSDIGSMIEWLAKVKGVMKDVAFEKYNDIPQDKQMLIITQQHDIDMESFLMKDGYPTDIKANIKILNKLLMGSGGIAEFYSGLSSNQQNYFNIRFGTGLNTILVYHEQLLEVMTNGE